MFPTQPQEVPPFISRQVTDAEVFYLNLSPTARDIAIVCGGWEQCAADYVINRSSFPYYSIEFVASGEGELELGGESHRLAPGLVFSYGPGIPHSIRTSKTERLRKYFVDFAGDEAGAILRKFGLAPGQAVKTAYPVPIRKAFDAMIEAAFVRDKYVEHAAWLHLEMLLIWIQRGANDEGCSKQRSAAVFDRCRQYINTHFSDLSTVEQVAAACHINVAYMTRLFRRFQNETPYQYLQRLRVQWAAERLQRLGYSVKAVADHLNMDPFHFSRVFKRYYGVPPSAYSSPTRMASIPQLDDVLAGTEVRTRMGQHANGC